MNAPDLTTVGALVAAIIALAEVLKVSGKLLMSKYGPKNGAEAHQINIEKALDEQNKLLQAVLERLAGVAELTKECHNWHKPEISPGVKVWWSRPDLEKEISNLSEHVAALDETISVLASAVEPLSKDVAVVKEEVHDMALREKYRRGGTGNAFKSVGTKKDG